MSMWTHVVGSFYIETYTEIEDLKSHIEEQLKLAPKITGSESNADIFVNPLSGYNTFVSPDCSKCVYKKPVTLSTTTLYIQCDIEKRHHCPEGKYQTCAAITIVGDLRDKDVKTTMSEIESFIDYLNSLNYYIYCASVTVEGSTEFSNIWGLKFNSEDTAHAHPIWERRK